MTQGRSKRPGLQKLHVSRAALMARINRKLRADDEVLKASQSERTRQDAGDFYVIRYGGAAGRNIIMTHVDPVAYARELGVLKPWEEAEV